MYTDDFLDLLISCEKEIIDPPGKLKEDKGNLKSNFTLKSTVGEYYFYGFIRQNVQFPENFSIGLIYNPKEERGTLDILRRNGPHGENIAQPHHIGCHIHRAGAERISQGLKSDGNIEFTEEYATLDDAKQYFINLIRLNESDKQKYFPPPSGQIDMFDNE